MASKREALLIKAIKDETELFTSEDILTVAGIDSEEVEKLLDKVSNNTDEIISVFLKEKIKAEKR